MIGDNEAMTDADRQQMQQVIDDAVRQIAGMMAQAGTAGARNEMRVVMFVLPAMIRAMFAIEEEGGGGGWVGPSGMTSSARSIINGVGIALGALFAPAIMEQCQDICEHRPPCEWRIGSADVSAQVASACQQYMERLFNEALDEGPSIHQPAAGRC